MNKASEQPVVPVSVLVSTSIPVSYFIEKVNVTLHLSDLNPSVTCKYQGIEFDLDYVALCALLRVGTDNVSSCEPLCIS